MTDKPPKLLDQVRARIRVMHYSIRTEQAYVDWAKRFILFHNKRHPAEMGKTELEAFLSYLAVERRVSASTQTQAKSALLFLYQQVWGLSNCSNCRISSAPSGHNAYVASGVFPLSRQFFADDGRKNLG